MTRDHLGFGAEQITLLQPAGGDVAQQLLREVDVLGSKPPPELAQSLPYVMTVLALVLVSSRAARLRFGAPAALGLPYVREER